MQNNNIIDPLWNLVDPLTVPQAAALIASFDPNIVVFNSYNEPRFIEEFETENDKINRIKVTYNALKNAINGDKLKAKINYPAEPEFLAWGTNSNYESCFLHGAVEVETTDNSFAVLPEPDFSKTLIEVFELRKWLKSMGINTGFFFPNATDAPDYLDSTNSRYAPKLAAAVKAWLSVTDPKGKHPKQALAKWLR